MNPFGKGSRKSFEAFWRRTSTGVIRTRAPRFATQPLLRLYHYHDRSFGECMRKVALSKSRIGANGYFKDFWFGNLEGNLSTRYNVDQCAKSRYAINSTAFQRTNNRTAYVNWMLEHKQAINSWYKNPAFVRDESIAVHGKTIREAITLEFGSDALRVLRESQAWFRERVRRFLKEGGDPAF